MKEYLRINFELDNTIIGAGLYSGIKNYSDIIHIIKELSEVIGVHGKEEIIYKLSSFYANKDGIVKDLKITVNHRGVCAYPAYIVNEFTSNGSLILYKFGKFYEYHREFQTAIVNLNTLEISLDLEFDGGDEIELTILNECIKDPNIKIIPNNTLTLPENYIQYQVSVNFDMDEIDNVIKIFKMFDKSLKRLNKEW